MRPFSQKFKIGSNFVGDGAPVYIVAEAGVAHFGSEEKAYRLVDLAVEAGADAVKFQIFNVDALISTRLPEWRERLTGKQLAYEAFYRIKNYCKDRGITFFATAHDEPSLDFLVSLDVPAYKIGSGEVGNWPFIRKAASFGKPLIISIGMYRPEQIRDALETINAAGNRDVVVLHCVTRYPVPPNEVSLGNLKLIRDRYGVITGYSDHTEGFHFPLAAAALGARVIEKHISLDFNVPNAQDWRVSCGPHNFGEFIRYVREIEAGLKTREIGPTPAEAENLNWAAKSIVPVRDIPCGAVICPQDLTVKRAGSGIPASQIGNVIGRITKAPLLCDEAVKWEQLK